VSASAVGPPDGRYRDQHLRRWCVVEISEDALSGEALDMSDVPFELLELRPRYRTPPADGVEA
jgi:hypothetical protein